MNLRNIVAAALALTCLAPSFVAAQTYDPLQNARVTTAPIGCGTDTVFPTTISTSGTSLGTPVCPNGQVPKGVEIDVPAGATVYTYIALSQASSAAAAATVAHALVGPASSGYTSYQFNLSASQLEWVTSVTAGTSTTFSSALPTFRWI